MAKKRAGTSPISGYAPPADTQFKPGQSGNPKGKERGPTITTMLRRIVEQDDKGKVVEALARAGIDAAMKGDFRFWQAIVDRLDGPVQDRIATEGKIEVVVRYVDKQPDVDDDD